MIVDRTFESTDHRLVPDHDVAMTPAPDAGAGRGRFPFDAHVELLQFFLLRRGDIVDGIEGLLNAQRKPVEYRRNGELLFDLFEDCFFSLTGVTQVQARLRGRLEEAHWADGFKPRDIPGLDNGLFDPAEMMVRGFHLWDGTRWPGRNVRVRYAHTLFNLYLLRLLTFLSMRIWDAGPGTPGERLAGIQGLLDELWRTAPADGPVLVRDARWLMQLAQSPATDDLGAYFRVAARVAEGLPESDRLEIHKAGVWMASGHLRSQIRYYCLKMSVGLDDEWLIRTTRLSNALDFGLLVQDLVPLLRAYERAIGDDDGARRRELAGVICQGVSPDPELFLRRVALLGPYSMVEHVFVTTAGDDREGNGDRAAYTPLGRRHVQLLEEYQRLIARLSEPLLEDVPYLRPVPGAYSPYGLIYGFSSDLIEHMTLKTLQPDAGPAPRFGLEDVFVDGDAGKLAWVNSWRKLPHLPREVQTQFDYPQEFADAIFERIAATLRRCAADRESKAAVRTGRLVIARADGLSAVSASSVPGLPLRYLHSSDRELVAARRAGHRDESRLAHERREGMCLVSYSTASGSVALSKTVLSEVLEAGEDAKVAGVPATAVEVLRLMCPGLAVVADDSEH